MARPQVENEEIRQSWSSALRVQPIKAKNDGNSRGKQPNMAWLRLIYFTYSRINLVFNANACLSHPVVTYSLEAGKTGTGATPQCNIKYLPWGAPRIIKSNSKRDILGR